GAGRLQTAETRGTCHREDDVRALADQVVRGVPTLRLVLEAVGEQALLRRLVPAEHLDRGSLALVVVLDAFPEAVHEDGDGRDRQAAERADLAGLAHARGQVAGE